MPTIVADPDPEVRGTDSDPAPDTSIINQAKIAQKNLNSYFLWFLYDFLSLKNDVNVASKSSQQKNFDKNLKKNNFY